MAESGSPLLETPLAGLHLHWRTVTLLFLAANAGALAFSLLAGVLPRGLPFGRLTIAAGRVEIDDPPIVAGMPPGTYATLTVTDTGPGIAAADRERVMERFVRGTDTGNGCGLGLAIVREIIERHQGSVTLADAAPHGLRVILTLPLAASQEH